MPNSNDDTLHHLDALNSWLGDVYAEGTGFSTLLIDAGFSEVEIEQIKLEHLNKFLQAVIELLAGYRDLRNEDFDNLMVRHYGLADRKPQSFAVIGHSEGVSPERIRQLVNKRLVLFHAPERQAELREAFTVICRRLLDISSS